MRNYINPSAYAYSNAEWNAFSFVDRLNDLIEFMLRCKNYEGQYKRAYDLVRFRSSDVVMDQVYLLNPHTSAPSAAAHYQQLYRSRIFPELLRRIDHCPVGPCGGLAAAPLPAPVALAPSTPVIQAFVDECGLCAICGSRADAALITHSDAQQLGAPQAFFRHVLLLDHPDMAALVDPVDVFPWVKCEDQDQLVAIAIEAALSQRRLADATWNRYRPSQIVIQPSFWRSLRQADFGDLEMHYKQRIVSCLTQVICGRSVDTQEHRMVNQSINVNGANQNKWNAYVFQMTAGPQDHRCSRIYFARTAQGVVLSEYEPDAH